MAGNESERKLGIELARWEADALLAHYYGRSGNLPPTEAESPQLPPDVANAMALASQGDIILKMGEEK